MRTFLVLLNREIRSFFNTPIAYVVMVFFLGVLGFGFYLGVSAINGRPSFTVTVIELLFGPLRAVTLCVSLIKHAFVPMNSHGRSKHHHGAVKDCTWCSRHSASSRTRPLFPPTLLFSSSSWVSGGVVNVHSIAPSGPRI
jgi:hypothetical protein